ncbi:MAG: 50S ribosomal protein L13 [Patescibacteria group bacterium]
MIKNQTKHQYGLKTTVKQIDATDMAVGRLATEVVTFLRGKHKAAYSPQTDCGDIVEVSNIGKIKWTGNKLAQHRYFHFSGYPGGLKITKAADVFKKNPGEVLRRTIFCMLPKNRLRNRMMKRLRIK